VVPAGVDQIRLTLSTPPVVTREPIAVQIEGRATVQGKPVVRRATAAEDMMQAFAYRHLVPADDLRVCVIARGAVRVPVRLLSAVPVKLAAGGSARVRVALPPGFRTFENLQLELSEPPDGITLGAVEIGQGGAEFVVSADPAKITPGFRGNLIVTVSGERVPGPNAQVARPGGAPTPPGGQNAAAAQVSPAGQAAPNMPTGQTAPPPGQTAPPPAAARRRITIGTLPAIAVEIVPPGRQEPAEAGSSQTAGLTPGSLSGADSPWMTGPLRITFERSRWPRRSSARRPASISAWMSTPVRTPISSSTAMRSSLQVLPVKPAEYLAAPVAGWPPMAPIEQST